MKVHFIFFLFCVYLLSPVQGQAQMVYVSGFVKNHASGKMKGNVSVFESVSGIGTITNSDGYYRLLLNPGLQKLEISSPGFITYSSTFTLRADTIISVELVPLSFSPEKPVGEEALDVESYFASKLTREPANKAK